MKKSNSIIFLFMLFLGLQIESQAQVNATIATSVDVLCNGDATGSATAVGSGGVAPYTFLWDDAGAQNAATASNLTAGTYNVTVTDANSATATTSVTITEPTSLSAVIATSVDVLCQGDCTGSATVNASGGVAPYVFVWDASAGNQTTATATNLCASSYAVTVTDANGCTVTETVSISEPATAVSANVTVTSDYNGSNISCFGNADGELTVVGLGGTGALSYVWDHGANTAVVFGLSDGTYTVTATDANGCTAVASGTLIEPSQLVAHITSVTNESTAGANDGIASASASGGTGFGQTYQWDATAGNQITMTATGLGAGNYTVTATDVNGCDASVTAVVGLGSTLSASITSTTDVLCHGDATGSATVAATGGAVPYTYFWNDVGGQTTATAISLVAGYYDVTVTDNNGVSVVRTAIVGQPSTEVVATASVTSSFNGTDVSCFGAIDGEATIVPTGGVAPYTFLWSDVGAQTTHIATGLGAGTYSVTATDGNNCSATATVTVVDPPIVTATITNVTDESTAGANDGSATVAASGGVAPYDYAWSVGSTPATATGLAAGNYSVTVSDANGCEASTAAVVGTGNSLSATITSSANVSCFGGSDGIATASATGGAIPYTYLWSNNQTTATATGLIAGTYTVTITDNNGLTDVASIIITEPATAMTATAAVTSNYNGEDISCNGAADGEVTITAVGGTAPYTFQWNGGVQASNVITGLVAGTYQITVTDANGCIALPSVTLMDPSQVSPAITSVTNESTAGANDGAATVAANGGTGAYVYLWDVNAGNQTTTTATGLGAGTYDVTVTDVNGCTASTTAPINVGSNLSATITSSTDVLCNGAATGSATAIATGGTAPYTYTWSDGQTTATATGLSAGSYTVTVTDDLGASVVRSVTITQPVSSVLGSAAITSNYNGSDVSCNGAADGEITVTAVGGTPGYTYSIDGGITMQAGSVFSNLAAGTYSLMVMDANGCTDAVSVTVTEPTALTASITSQVDAHCFGDCTGEATISTIGGVAPYTYLWSDGQNAATAQMLCSGNYTVTVFDANGCFDIVNVSIIEPATALSVEIVSGIPNSSAASVDGSLTAVATGGTTPYVDYHWINGAHGATMQVSANTLFNVTVTDANGCTAVSADQMTAVNDPTDTTYIALQPDSTLADCPTLASYITTTNSFVQNNGSIIGTFTADPLGSACFDYVAANQANETDTLEVITCDVYCDTTVYIIETGTCVWPGDADDNQIVDNQDLLAIGLHYGTSGLTRIDASTNYTCQPSRDWGTILTGSTNTDIKHLDTDGNAVINDDDTLAISLNWNQVHLRGNDNWDRNGAPVTIGTDMATPGDGIALPIYLGDATNVVNNGYGIAFTVEYDSAVVEPNSVAISFDNAWLGTSTNSLSIQKDFYNDQNIQAAFTRTDQMALTGSGQLGTIYLTIKDVVLPRNNGEIRLPLTITNVRLIDNVGDEIPVSPEAGEVLISSTMKVEDLLGLNVYPNPTKDQLTVELEQTTIEQIKVYSMSSQLILDLRPTGMEKQHTLSVESLEAGAYILEVQTPKGMSHQIFVKQ